jgi:hypothetical protein
VSRARWSRLSLWLVTGLLILACAPPRPIQRAGWQGDRALEVLEPLLWADADHLLQLEDLTAEVGFSVHKVGSASGSILFRPPALLRIDVRGPLFQRILSAVLDGDRLLALADGRLYQMPSSDGLDAFLHIDLAGYDPRLALLGVIVPPQSITAIDYPRVDRARLTLNDGIEGQRRRLWVNLHRGFAEREELLNDQGQAHWSRQMSDWKRVADTELYLPRKIRIESQDQVLELDYGDLHINKELQRATFYSGIGEP